MSPRRVLLWWVPILAQGRLAEKRGLDRMIDRFVFEDGHKRAPHRRQMDAFEQPNDTVLIDTASSVRIISPF